MLYRVLKIWVGLAAKIFCRKIIISHPERLKMDGPLLLASNHPNSFLDAILLDILFKQPVWSLARGDVFKNSFYTRLLGMLKILPVYRTSEGTENLEINYRTFDACKQIFRMRGVVQVFSEGTCINEWHLRPLKKGTARLAISAWEEGIDLTVLPVGINYSSFTRFGKNIFLNFGTPVRKQDILSAGADGKRNLDFNERLRVELEQLVFEIPATDREKRKKLLLIHYPILYKLLLAVPAFAGIIVNAPIYFPLRYFTQHRKMDADHYDSVLMALLVFTYPFYLCLVSFLCCWWSDSWLGLLVFIVFPFTAWATVQIKSQLDK